jgi:hypothetical protein
MSVTLIISYPKLVAPQCSSMSHNISPISMASSVAVTTTKRVCFSLFAETTVLLAATVRYSKSEQLRLVRDTLPGDLSWCEHRLDMPLPLAFSRRHACESPLHSVRSSTVRYGTVGTCKPLYVTLCHWNRVQHKVCHRTPSYAAPFLLGAKRIESTRIFQMFHNYFLQEVTNLFAHGLI